MTIGSQSFEVKESTIQGKGLFAKGKIAKGEAVVEWHPKVLTKEEASKLPAVEQKHYLYPDGDKLLYMQEPERYVNHSCDANTHVVNRSDVASRDIEKGEEITSDYLDLDTEDFACSCGTSKCRRPRV
jgi:uncharacterized protein